MNSQSGWKDQGYSRLLWRGEAFVIAVLGCAAFGALAYFSIELTRNGGRIAAVWLPNALAVAFLLRARIANEALLLAGLWIGNVTANLLHQDSLTSALIFSLANMIEISLVVRLTRKMCGERPDMQRLDHLARFAGIAAVAGALASACVAQIAITLQFGFNPQKMATWALSDGLALLILTPTALIVADALTSPRWPDRKVVIDWIVLTTISTIVTVAVFAQTSFPLLFLIPPLVVAFAFKLGSLGTAFATLKIAVIAIVFTSAGLGPITLAQVAERGELLLLQCFLAASFLIGLPVSAVLNGNRRMVHELAKQEEQQALLTTNITDAVLRLDQDGICTYGSPSVERVLGRPIEDLVGQRVTERLHPEAAAKLRYAEQTLLNGESEHERITYRRLHDDENGQPVFLEADCAVARHPETGERAGIIFCARDVTKRVMLERQLSHARANAEQAARAKSRFLANMSHEIRTPMNGVLGFAELLRQSDLPPREAQFAQTIVESGHSMMAILNDILDLSKIEAGELHVINAPIDVVSLAQECCDLYREEIERRGVTLDFSIDRQMPDKVLGDAQRLRQILLNLIGNASKFTQQGSIEVCISNNLTHYSISVMDTGIGIGRDRLEDIFERFIQGDDATDRSYGGTGLGLAISAQLAETLGGTLEAESEIGTGSSFTLKLPLKRVKDNTPNTHINRTNPFPKLPGSARILLAEDHEINRMLVTAMLDQCGVAIDVARDGEEAIERVVNADRAGTPFDLVLMDIQMPRCDGYEATRAIRMAGISAERLPIIALTANAFADDINASKVAGMQAHLAKPLVFDALVSALNRWLPHRIVAEDDSHESGQAGDVRLSDETDLISEWLARRSDALDGLESALEANEFHGSEAAELARAMHKVAGVAGAFGEAELGESAAILERALKSGLPGEKCRELARAVLKVAEKTNAPKTDSGEKETAAP